MSSYSQNKITTTGDNSPAVIAKSFSSIYGVRSEAIIEILNTYEQEGVDLKSRRKVTEEILKKYSISPERENKETKLSDATKDKLGIQQKPKILDALEWDLFSKTNHLITSGDNSPAISSSGDVFIWYGIPSKTLRALASQLEKNMEKISSFEQQLLKSVENYQRIKNELDSSSERDSKYHKAMELLNEGKLVEANKLISRDDFNSSEKHFAYEGYIYGLMKELLSEFKEAERGYKRAVNNNDSNVFYNLKYGEILKTLDKSKEAIIYVEKALELLNQNESDLKEEDFIHQKLVILNQLGYNYHEIGNFNKAIFYHEKSINFIKEFYGEEHYLLGMHYVNLGRCWDSKNSLDMSIEFYEKALPIYTKKYGEDCWGNAGIYYNIGATLFDKGDINNAKEYLEKAEKIYLSLSFNKPPHQLGILYFVLGRTYRLLHKYDDALVYFKKSEDIFSSFLEVSHKDFLKSLVAIYETLGIIGINLQRQGKYKESNNYFNNAYAYAQRKGSNSFSVYCLMNLGKNKSLLNMHNDALHDFNEALDILSRTTKTDRNKKNLESDRVEILIGKIYCLKKLGKQKELNEFLKEFNLKESKNYTIPELVNFFTHN